MSKFWYKKKIIITGGAGFIGAHLANNLLSSGSEITVIDNLERGNKKNLNKKIRFHKLDLREKSTKILNLFENVDIVFHLASKVGGINFYLDNSYTVIRDNILIDTNVLNLVVKNKIKNYFYASSSHIYPKSLQNSYKIVKLHEKDSNNSHPFISYGWAKLLGEEQAKCVSNDYKGLNISIGRLVGIYGPNQDSNLKNGSVIPVLCKRAINYPNYKFEILTNGKEIRSYCHITDAIMFMKLLIENKSKGKIKNDIFNICSDEHHTIETIAKKIIKISGKNIKLDKKNNKGLIKSQFCSNERIKKITGWKPKISLDYGLKSVYDKLMSEI